MKKIEKEILQILVKDARISNQDIADMIGSSAKEVEKIIDKLEKDEIILSYHAIINDGKIKLPKSRVRALIEVDIRPEKRTGFDKIASRICRFKIVKEHYLISGRYDFLLIVEANSMEEISSFVSEKLASIENVKGTGTYFIMKKYKENGIIFEEHFNNRLLISP